jgi:TrpR family trp operon transcriptional repressor
MVRFLQEILTPAEIYTLVLRWELVKLLHKGVPQRQISQRLGISLCKITRGSREMKKEGSAIREVLQQSEETMTDEKWKEEIDD